VRQTPAGTAFARERGRTGEEVICAIPRLHNPLGDGPCRNSESAIGSREVGEVGRGFGPGFRGLHPGLYSC